MNQLQPDWALGAQILVLGDIMLDRYVSGAVEKVSQEAPVPILHQQAESFAPGGAANVAANIAALGAGAILIGVIGEDANAPRLQALLASHHNLDAASVIRDATRPTTLKTRYLAGHHQMLRVDHETRTPVAPAIEDRQIAAAKEALTGCNALILSDYAKGALTDRVLSEVIAAARNANLPIIVDPKRPDWSAYAGADFITPNRRELERATGLPCDSDDNAARAAAAMHRQIGAAILLTRAQHGMTLFRPDQPPAPVPARAREIFDVTGAGDTVAAVFALALATGRGPEDAIQLANTAAGIVVTRQGAAQTTSTELAAALQDNAPAARAGGCISLENARRLRSDWAADGLTVGFANGCFDLLHPGHLHLIDQAAAACDRLILAINEDASVARLKGPDRPVQPAAVRAAILAAVRGVDVVVSFSEDTPLNLIETLRPDLLVKGEDYAEADIVGADIVRANGGRILRARLLHGHSTSSTVLGMRKSHDETGQSG